MLKIEYEYSKNSLMEFTLSDKRWEMHENRRKKDKKEKNKKKREEKYRVYSNAQKVEYEYQIFR